MPPAVRGVARATVDIAAPPERVFQALTDPAELAAWWGGPGDDAPGGDVSDPRPPRRDHTEWHVDARPGGRWSVRTNDAEGGASTTRGVYRVVDAPRTLEFSWHEGGDGDVPSTVRYDLVPRVVDGVPGTRLTVTHTGTHTGTHAGGADGATARAFPPRSAHAFAAAPLVAALLRHLRPTLRPPWDAHGAVAWTAVAWAARPPARRASAAPAGR